MNDPIMNGTDRVFVAGHNGMVGSAILRRLISSGHGNVVTRSRADLDLRDQRAVDRFFDAERPAYVILAAGKVGGIAANNAFPADFIRDNLQIQTNVIDAAYRHDVRKFLFLGSSCIYPKFAPQPIAESSLLTGLLEQTNEWYAIAKIAGMKMCEAYRRQYGFNAIAAMPTNLYGPGDNFDLASAHVLPAMIRKFHLAKLNKNASVTIWGTGTPRREFLYVEDLADACIYLMNHYDDAVHVNIGCGEDLSIRELAERVSEVVGFDGQLVFDTSMPDGTPRKLLDVSKMTQLGWQARTSLHEGLARTYAWFSDTYEQEKLRSA